MVWMAPKQVCRRSEKAAIWARANPVWVPTITEAARTRAPQLVMAPEVRKQQIALLRKEGEQFRRVLTCCICIGPPCAHVHSNKSRDVVSYYLVDDQ